MDDTCEQEWTVLDELSSSEDEYTSFDDHGSSLPASGSGSPWGGSQASSEDLGRKDYTVITKFLPPKHEYVIAVRLSKLQIKLYQKYLELNVKHDPDPTKVISRGATLFEDYNNLMCIWTHPWVLKLNEEREEKKVERRMVKAEKTTDPETRDEEGRLSRKTEEAWWNSMVMEEHKEMVELSGKVILLFEILRLAQSVGDKVLVFSQSLLSLDLIEGFLAMKTEEAEKAEEKKRSPRKGGGSSTTFNKWIRDEDYYRMDGSTGAERRKHCTTDFSNIKNERMRLFLMSTSSAGGLGINLDSANRVIIFDASWNPSHDIQSIFRVYRFGQVKPVYVYRFLAQGTMEEKIYERVKEALSERVVDEHQLDRHFNFSDLQELYRFSPNRLEDEDKDKPTPKDLVLAELLRSKKDWIVGYHEPCDKVYQEDFREKLLEATAKYDRAKIKEEDEEPGDGKERADVPSAKKEKEELKLDPSAEGNREDKTREKRRNENKDQNGPVQFDAEGTSEDENVREKAANEKEERNGKKREEEEFRVDAVTTTSSYTDSSFDDASSSRHPFYSSCSSSLPSSSFEAAAGSFHPSDLNRSESSEDLEEMMRRTLEATGRYDAALLQRRMERAMVREAFPGATPGEDGVKDEVKEEVKEEPAGDGEKDGEGKVTNEEGKEEEENRKDGESKKTSEENEKTPEEVKKEGKNSAEDKMHEGGDDKGVMERERMKNGDSVNNGKTPAKGGGTKTGGRLKRERADSERSGRDGNSKRTGSERSGSVTRTRGRDGKPWVPRSPSVPPAGTSAYFRKWGLSECGVNLARGGRMDNEKRPCDSKSQPGPPRARKSVVRRSQRLRPVSTNQQRASPTQPASTNQQTASPGQPAQMKDTIASCQRGLRIQPRIVHADIHCGQMVSFPDVGHMVSFPPDVVMEKWADAQEKTHEEEDDEEEEAHQEEREQGENNDQEKETGQGASSGSGPSPAKKPRTNRPPGGGSQQRPKFVNADEQVCLVVMRDTFTQWGEDVHAAVKMEVMHILCAADAGKKPRRIARTLSVGAPPVPSTDPQETAWRAEEAELFCESTIFPALRMLSLRADRKRVVLDIQKLLFL